jgi:ABC-type nitrate/sulfonate/bicarbonate transport system substrate-binding protein
MVTQPRSRHKLHARICVTAVIAVATALLAGCGNSAKANNNSVAGGITTVKYSYPSPVASLLHIFVADAHPEICAPFGIRIKAVAVAPEAAVTSVASKSVQLSEMPVTSLLAAAAKSPGSLQAVAYTGPEEAALWAKKGTKSVADLKGSVGAATAEGSTSDIYLRTMFKEAGLVPGTDVNIVYTKAQNATIALAVSGHVDVFPYSPPLPDAAIKAGFVELPEGRLDPASKEAEVLTHAIAVNPSYAKSHAAVISNALKCIDAVIAWIPGHKAEREAALVKYTAVDPALADFAYEHHKVTFAPGLQPPTEARTKEIISNLVGMGLYTQDQFNMPVSKIATDIYLKK